MLIPQPFLIKAGEGMSIVSAEVKIKVCQRNQELDSIAKYLRDNLFNFETGALKTDKIIGVGQIELRLEPKHPDLGEESYILEIGECEIVLTASVPSGIFMGVQTLLQIAQPIPDNRGKFFFPVCEIIDKPRFSWRGVMLDVSRHFFTPKDVKRVIDLIARYKLNRLHLHLTDDQGWRIEIKSWPDLTKIGGSTQVGGGEGGYYTQSEYLDLIDYAQSRYITIVPEIDLPGHTNAALASYSELNEDNQSPELYTGMDVGFSSLCLDKPITFQFLKDVISEIASLTPGPYLHIGGDEAKATKLEDYQQFIADLQHIVNQQGKQMIGWQEISQSALLPGSLVQYWTDEMPVQPLPDGVDIIMSPATRAYMDMKYHQSCELGLNWAGYVSIWDAYNWDPETYLDFIPPSSVNGIEAALWSETLETIADIEFMMFPRLLGYSEIGWSPKSHRNYEEYRKRLAYHGKILEALEVNFYRSGLIDW
jgi:hexosaminidase